MQITIATPHRPGAASGNDVTSARWARRLGELGHTVTVATVQSDADSVEPPAEDLASGSDLLIALHARRTAGAVFGSRHHCPNRPIVVGLAGTDLYQDLPHNKIALASIQAADRLVVLQETAITRLAEIEARLGAKAHVIHQSVEPPLPERAAPTDQFVVVVLAHLRDVKDPLLAAQAAALLPDSSRVEVRHAGHAHDQSWRQRAVDEQAANPRYRWLGELDRPEAMKLLASATVLACTSRLEGGANVVTEAIALGVPVVGTQIDGNIGLLGASYPGLVPVGGREAMAAWLNRLETEPGLLSELTHLTNRRHPITLPATERESWAGALSFI